MIFYIREGAGLNGASRFLGFEDRAAPRYMKDV